MTSVEKNNDTVLQETKNDVSMRTLSAATAMAVLLLPALGAAQLTKLPDPTKFERKRDLSEYKTYAWSRDQVPAANLANHLRIINAVQDEMKERGYRIDTIRPDVRIRYRLTLTERVQGNATQQRSVWDNANSTVQIDFLSREARGLQRRAPRSRLELPSLASQRKLPARLARPCRKANRRRGRRHLRTLSGERLTGRAHCA